ncbi:hypothetical protein BSY238_2117 [Methyloversatilis sp. RAC08]|nr:hypothetical protein BSY238_2117 [Methyloversatilis sp. RAC08]
MNPKHLLVLASFACVTTTQAAPPAVGDTVKLPFESMDGVLTVKLPLFPQPETGSETMQERHSLTRSIQQLQSSVCAYNREQLRALRGQQIDKEAFTVLDHRETRWPRERGGALKHWMLVRNVHRPACEGWIDTGSN